MPDFEYVRTHYASSVAQMPVVSKVNTYKTSVSTNTNSDQLPETWMADLLKDTARSIPDSPERLAFLAMAEIEMMRIREIRGQKQ